MTDTEQTVISDSMIERDRLSRTGVAIILALGTLGIPSLLGAKIASDWFGYYKVGLFVGLALGLVGLYYLSDRILVHVGLNRAFITTDALKAAFKKADKYTAYGPGIHASFPWELRQATGNISLDEASQDFSVTVNTTSGNVEVVGSYRIRPRFETKALIAFFGSVAVIAKDIGDLIRGYVTEELASKNLDSVLRGVQTLNQNLKNKFGKGDPAAKDPEISRLEERFGLVVGDVTAAQLNLSAEAAKTRTGVDEAVVANRGTAILLGFNDETRGGKTTTAEKKMEIALKKGAITNDQIVKARQHFLAISENLTMNVDVNEYEVRVSADSEVKELFTKYAPQILPLLRKMKGGQGGGKGESKPKK